MKNNSTLIKTVPFSEVNLWDVKRFNYIFNQNFDNASFLKDILKPFKQKVSKEEMLKNNWQIIAKINFAGELFLRDSDEISSYKGSLNKVPENSIIYSKINVRHGCLYYHEKGMIPFGVSSEYPTFTFDDKKINGLYLKRVLRSEEFKRLLNTKTSGISKARVKVEEFLDIKIPLPTIEEQNRIIDRYNKKISFAKSQFIKGEELENKINKLINDSIGIEIKNTNLTSQQESFSLVKYQELEKWGVEAQNKTKIKYTKGFPVSKISKICAVSSGGTPSRSKPEYYNGNIPWIKTGEVVNSIINDTEEKITAEAIKNSSAKLYNKGSLIIAMYGQGKTRGRTAKLGIDATTNQACAVLFDINNELILTDFLWAYLLNEYDRLRELASGNNQPNLNAQMIKDYPVVIPPINIQKKLIDDVNRLKQEVNDLKEKSELEFNTALKDFEQEIFNA
jgi:type I restriction enzyme S subunit